MNAIPLPQFRVFTGEQVHAVVRENRHAVLDAVEAAYRAHHAGRTVNPESQFLRFPDGRSNRIIALPAHIDADDGDIGDGVTGIKWISSFPENIAHGMPRASAVLILNDPVTGYPMACMEASIISAARTAASAISALKCLAGRGPTQSTNSSAVRIAFVGTGLIARHVAEGLPLAGVPIEQVILYDLNETYAAMLAGRIQSQLGYEVTTASSLEQAIRQADVVVFTTTAAVPYVENPDWFSHCPVVLHLSLRDLAPAVILEAHNVVDDIEHCLRAMTSLHRTEMATGHRRFVTTSLPHLLSGGEAPTRDRPIVFSPFGMGILDIAVGRWVYDRLAAQQAPIPRFFYDMQRA